VAMLIEDCWSEQDDHPRDPSCPELPSGTTLPAQ